MGSAQCPTELYQQSNSECPARQECFVRLVKSSNLVEKKGKVRMQKGSLFEQGGSWCVRWSERENGKRVYRFAKIATKAEYPRKAEVRAVFRAFMDRVNAATSNPQMSGGISLAEFVKRHYLPYVDRTKSASTSHGYHGLWSRYVQESELADLRVVQVQTVHIRRLLLATQNERRLSTRTFQHLKSFLSAIFTYAQNEGLVSSNPVHGALLPEDAAGPRETYAYDLKEINTMLGVLSGAAKAFVAIGAFSGLRLGEIQGLQWEDIADNEIAVRRAVWRGIVDEPKTTASKAAVPLVPTLEKVLEAYRTEEGKPVVGPLFGMELEKLAQRIVKPIVEAVGLKWHGAHALRRGIATNLYSLGASDKIVQRVLRHAKANVTREHYVKAVPADVRMAMHKLDLAFTNPVAAA